MKSLLMVVVALFCLNASADVVAVVDQSQYTCKQLSTHLDQTGEFYVQSLFGPRKIDEMGCSQAKLQFQNCEDIYDSVYAKDGYCQLGLACRCPHKKKHGKKHHGPGAAVTKAEY